jgi:hypothetical protein
VCSSNDRRVASGLARGTKRARAIISENHPSSVCLSATTRDGNMRAALFCRRMTHFPFVSLLAEVLPLPAEPKRGCTHKGASALIGKSRCRDRGHFSLPVVRITTDQRLSLIRFFLPHRSCEIELLSTDAPFGCNCSSSTRVESFQWKFFSPVIPTRGKLSEGFFDLLRC